MAFTRVLGPGIHTASNINSHNINSTGIITAVSFVGDGSGLTGVASTDNIITGTAATFNTYPVDINAGMDVVGVSSFQDIDVDGHTNLDNVSVAGVTTFASSIYLADSIIHEGDTDTKIDFAPNQIKLTASNRLRIDFAANAYNYLYGTQLIEATSTNPKPGASTYVARFRDTTGDNTEVQFFNTNVTNTILAWNDYGNSTTAGNLVFKGVVGGSGVEHARFTGSGNFNLLRDLDVDGHTNLDNVSIVGVITATGSAHFQDLVLTDTTPTITFTDTNNNPDYRIQVDGGALKIFDVQTYTNSIIVNSDSHVDISKLDVTGDLDVDGHTNLDNVSIAGVTTFSGGISGSTANLTGALTGTTANFSGNVTVGGVLTYEDVKNVDSIGIATARVGIKVLAGGVEIDGGGLDVVGVSTFNDDVTVNGTLTATSALRGGSLRFYDNQTAYFGTGNDLQIYHTGNTNIIDSNTAANLHIKHGNEKMAAFNTDGAVELYHNNIKRLETSSVGVSIPQDLDVDGNTDLDNVNIAGVTTHYDKVLIRQTGSANSTNVVPLEVQAFKGDITTGITTVLFDSSFARRPEFIFSNSHNGNWNNSAGQTQHWRILWKSPNESNTTDELVEIKPFTDIAGALSSFVIRTTDNSTGLKYSALFNSQQVSLYANNTLGLRVSQAGIGITDTIYHEGDTDTKIRFPANDTIRFVTAGSQRLNINSSGTVSITNDLDVDGHTNLDNVNVVGVVTASAGFRVPDGNYNTNLIAVGNHEDFIIYHDTAHTYLQNKVGNLRIQADALKITSRTGVENYIHANLNGAVEVYYDNSKKLETSEKGIKVGTGVTVETNGQATFTGIVTATSFKLANGSDVGTGAGGTWSTYTAGIATSKSVGVNTSTLDDNDLVGVGNSFQGLYISNGMIIHDNTLSGNHYIGTAFNGLMAGPVNIEGTLSVDGSYVVV